MSRRSLRQLYIEEFADYGLSKFHQDILAGLAVTAISLPLSMAFGIASGVTAASGLVSTVIAGILIGALSGAHYQISGSTGAMSAVLLVVVQQYGLDGMLIAGFLSGLFLLIIGLVRLGRFIAFVPSPVVKGFTSGIALIIIIGQIDNLFGISTPSSASALFKLFAYFQGGFRIDFHCTIIAVLVIGFMAAWPQKWNTRFNSSLIAIILATGMAWIFGWPVATVRNIPHSLVLEDRLFFSDLNWVRLMELIPPALTITALGALQSLLCGTVGSNMTGKRLQANQELVAQGIGNMAIPFFGGIPASAAIARTSVGIRAGGLTRLVSIFHALAILALVLTLSDFLSWIPLSALAGVLIVTAWNMNEWTDIRFIFSRKFKSDIFAFVITLLATITLNVTYAVLIGSFLAGGFFLSKIASMDINVVDVDVEKLKKRGIETAGKCGHVKVAYLTGPLFFAATGVFNEAVFILENTHALILSMRGVPLIDSAGLQVIARLDEKIKNNGGILMISSTHAKVLQMLEQAGLIEQIGAENFFWSSDQAIIAAEKRVCPFCERNMEGVKDPRQEESSETVMPPEIQGKA